VSDREQNEPIVVHLPPQEQMLQAVGRGIQVFATVELCLAILFASLMEPAPRELSVVALDAAGPLRTKLKIVESVADRRLAGTEREQARSILKQIEQQAAVRNKLAHWTVSHWRGASSAEDLKRVVVALVPPPASLKHGPVVWEPESSNLKPLFAADLDRFFAECNELIPALVTLSNKIAPPQGQPASQNPV